MTKIERETSIKKYAKLKQYWDGYDALPINPTVIKAALQINNYFSDDWDVVPLECGILEFTLAVNDKNWYSELDIYADKVAFLFLVDLNQSEYEDTLENFIDKNANWISINWTK